MTYFNYLPKIDYTFPDGSTKTVVDIYKRAYIKENKNKSIYDKIMMKGGQKPERFANNLYEDPHLFWQILYANNVISRDDWSLTDIELEDVFQNYYSGFSFHIFAKPELTLRRGDIITIDASGIPVDPDNWALVESYDENLRKVNCIYFTDGFFDSLEGTEIFIWRLKNANVDGDFSDTVFQIFSGTNIDPTFISKKVTRFQSSLYGFKNTNDKKRISPFNETSGGSLTENLIIGFDSTTSILLADYMNGNALPSNISLFTVKDYLTQLELEKRSVYIPKKTVVGSITDAFSIVMSSSNALSTYDSVSSIT